MQISKRDFLKITGMAAGSAALTGCGGKASAPTAPAASAAPELESITGEVKAITVEERKARIARAQSLMEEARLDAIVIEPGSSMVYFSGIQWWRSERATLLVIPRQGEMAVITPYFEEPSVRESMSFGEDVRTWHEHEDPFQLVAGVLGERGLRAGRLGVEESVRYFVVEGLKMSVPFVISGANEVVRGCRMYKTAHEIELMKKANEVTLRAYAHVYQSLEKGMRASDIKSLMSRAQTELGGKRAWNMALLGRASAYPHGSKIEEEVKEGQIILMDCGCAVEGYQSDISRTFVFGEPSKGQREMWQTVRKGQEVAYKSATLGAPAGSVDDAVRKFYETAGYGPDYKTPGLSHRTGHGIGMDGHESTNIVRGETTPLAPGMCFSNEPGLYDFDRFGVRLEDCIYMTETGPAWFTVPPDQLEDPIGKMG